MATTQPRSGLEPGWSQWRGPGDLCYASSDGAAERSDKQQLSFWDALSVEAAVAAGCRVILSEDMQAGRDYEDGLRVENPYAGIASPKPRSR